MHLNYAGRSIDSTITGIGLKARARRLEARIEDTTGLRAWIVPALFCPESRAALLENEEGEEEPLDEEVAVVASENLDRLLERAARGDPPDDLFVYITRLSGGSALVRV